MYLYYSLSEEVASNSTSKSIYIDLSTCPITCNAICLLTFAYQDVVFLVLKTIHWFPARFVEFRLSLIKAKKSQGNV